MRQLRPAHARSAGGAQKLERIALLIGESGGVHVGVFFGVPLVAVQAAGAENDVIGQAIVPGRLANRLFAQEMTRHGDRIKERIEQETGNTIRLARPSGGYDDHLLHTAAVLAGLLRAMYHATVIHGVIVGIVATGAKHYVRHWCCGCGGLDNKSGLDGRGVSDVALTKFQHRGIVVVVIIVILLQLGQQWLQYLLGLGDIARQDSHTQPFLQQQLCHHLTCPTCTSRHQGQWRMTCRTAADSGGEAMCHSDYNGQKEDQRRVSTM
mmetsp:Transcript_11795/g.32696  ORF Transcript_11795/g.32696 Transcript_11795/m.32696 type:complete len:266 (-) Transcript_11795:58-855(-)